MADKLRESIDPINDALPQLFKNLGAIGPAGETVYALLVAVSDGGGAITIDGSAASTVADGADVTQGAIADAVVAAGATGSISAKLRRLTTDLDALKTELQGKADLTENQPVKLSGSTQTLLAATTITTDATTAYTAVTGLDIYSRCVVQLIVSGKVMDASTTLNIYIQRSVDGGTNWDDIGSFAQVTSAAIADGTYYMGLALSGVSQVDRIKADGTLTANTVASFTSWGDRLRVKKISANFAGSDTITIALTAYMIP